MQAHTGVCRSVCVRACELCLCGAAVRHSAHVSPGREASWHTNAAKLLRHHDRKRKLRFRAGCPAKGVAQAARLTQHRPQRKLLSHGHLLPKRNKKDCTVSRSYVVEVGDRITRRSVDGAGRGRSVDIQANRDQPLCCQLRCGCRGGKHRRSSFSRPCRALAPPSSSDKDGNKVLWAAAGVWEPGVALVFRVLGSHYCVIGVGRFSGRITFPRYRRVATARSVTTRFCSSVPAAP